MVQRQLPMFPEGLHWQYYQGTYKKWAQSNGTWNDNDWPKKKRKPLKFLKESGFTGGLVCLKIGKMTLYSENA